MPPLTTLAEGWVALTHPPEPAILIETPAPAGRPDMPDPRPATPSPAPVLPRVAAGEPAAVRACLERYGRLVYGMARRWLGSDADAEDATQEVFIELWKSAARFDPTAASELTFVAMITRRKLIDRCRRRHARPPEEGLPGPLADRSDLTPAWVVEDELSPVRAALGELPAVQQRVLLMAVCDGATHAQIADHTGLPLGTVKTYVRRGLQFVREQLSATGGVS